VLGDAWLPAAPLLAVFGCAAYGQVIGNPAGWLFLALGHTRAMLRWTLLLSGSLSVAFLLGLAFGPLGVAVCYAATLTLLRAPHFALALRDSPVSGRDVWHAVRGAIAVSALAGIAMLAARDATLALGPVVRTAVALLTCAGVSALGALLWAPARGDLAAVVGALRERHRLELADLSGAEPTT